jgi:uncharacterized protein YndB with AHSA1/START domain
MPSIEYAASCHIDAPPARVWAILTNASGYGDWNPEIVGMEGHFALGERITAKVKIGSGAIRRVPMRVTALEAPSLMQWTGGLPLGLFVGRRRFTVAPADRGAEFRLHLSMSGPLAGMIGKSVGDRQPEVDSFAAGLKAHAERGDSSG